MIVNKWNFPKHRYEPVEVDDSRNNMLIALMGESVCINCGELITYDNSYTSKQWHDELGIGFHVCESCKLVEIELQQKYPPE